MANSNGKSVSLFELARKYQSRDDCLDLLERLRWPDGPVCPRCGSEQSYEIKSRWIHECANCRYQFSATTGTIMHRSRLPLVKWVLAAALIANARKGVSACQVARDLHVTYKTAWYLCHRLCLAMREHEWLERFNGVCEVDECYVGGKPRKAGPPSKRGRGTQKTPVVGVRERGGKVRMRVVANVTQKTLGSVVREYIQTDAEMVIADQLSGYDALAAEFTMERINHAREYVRGNIHTNGIESIWAIVKRQVYGTHHKISKQYLPLYLAEISFRFNNRKNPDLFKVIIENGLLTDRAVVPESAG